MAMELLSLCENESWKVIEETMEDSIISWNFGDKDDEGNTPLLVCCKKGSLSTLKAFYSLLPDFNVKECNSEGSTMFLLACDSGNIHVVDWLLSWKSH